MTISYEVLSAAEGGPLGKRTSYGLCCRVNGAEAARVADLFDDAAEAARAAELFTREALSPLHLPDVVENLLGGEKLF